MIRTLKSTTNDKPKADSVMNYIHHDGNQNRKTGLLKFKSAFLLLFLVMACALGVNPKLMAAATAPTAANIKYAPTFTQDQYGNITVGLDATTLAGVDVAADGGGYIMLVSSDATALNGAVTYILAQLAAIKSDAATATKFQYEYPAGTQTGTAAAAITAAEMQTFLQKFAANYSAGATPTAGVAAIIAGAKAVVGTTPASITFANNAYPVNTTIIAYHFDKTNDVTVSGAVKGERAASDMNAKFSTAKNIMKTNYQLENPAGTKNGILSYNFTGAAAKKYIAVVSQKTDVQLRKAIEDFAADATFNTGITTVDDFLAKYNTKYSTAVTTIDSISLITIPAGSTVGEGQFQKCTDGASYQIMVVELVGGEIENTYSTIMLNNPVSLAATEIPVGSAYAGVININAAKDKLYISAANSEAATGTTSRSNVLASEYVITLTWPDATVRTLTTNKLPSDVILLDEAALADVHGKYGFTIDILTTTDDNGDPLMPTTFLEGTLANPYKVDVTANVVYPNTSKTYTQKTFTIADNRLEPTGHDFYVDMRDWATTGKGTIRIAAVNTKNDVTTAGVLKAQYKAPANNTGFILLPNDMSAISKNGANDVATTWGGSNQAVHGNFAGGVVNSPGQAVGAGIRNLEVNKTSPGNYPNATPATPVEVGDLVPATYAVTVYYNDMDATGNPIGTPTYATLNGNVLNNYLVLNPSYIPLVNTTGDGLNPVTNKDIDMRVMGFDLGEIDIIGGKVYTVAVRAIVLDSYTSKAYDATLTKFSKLQLQTTNLKSHGFNLAEANTMTATTGPVKINTATPVVPKYLVLTALNTKANGVVDNATYAGATGTTAENAINTTYLIKFSGQSLTNPTDVEEITRTLTIDGTVGKEYVPVANYDGSTPTGTTVWGYMYDLSSNGVNFHPNWEYTVTVQAAFGGNNLYNEYNVTLPVSTSPYKFTTPDNPTAGKHAFVYSKSDNKLYIAGVNGQDANHAGYNDGSTLVNNLIVDGPYDATETTATTPRINVGPLNGGADPILPVTYTIKIKETPFITGGSPVEYSKVISVSGQAYTGIVTVGNNAIKGIVVDVTNATNGLMNGTDVFAGFKPGNDYEISVQAVATTVPAGFSLYNEIITANTSVKGVQYTYYEVSEDNGDTWTAFNKTTPITDVLGAGINKIRIVADFGRAVTTPTFTTVTNPVNLLTFANSAVTPVVGGANKVWNVTYDVALGTASGSGNAEITATVGGNTINCVDDSYQIPVNTEGPSIEAIYFSLDGQPFPASVTEAAKIGMNNVRLNVRVVFDEEVIWNPAAVAAGHIPTRAEYTAQLPEAKVIEFFRSLFVTAPAASDADGATAVQKALFYLQESVRNTNDFKGIFDAYNTERSIEFSWTFPEMDDEDLAFLATLVNSDPTTPVNFGIGTAPGGMPYLLARGSKNPVQTGVPTGLAAPMNELNIARQPITLANVQRASMRYTHDVAGVETEFAPYTNGVIPTGETAAKVKYFSKDMNLDYTAGWTTQIATAQFKINGTGALVDAAMLNGKFFALFNFAANAEINPASLVNAKVKLFYQDAEGNKVYYNPSVLSGTQETATWSVEPQIGLLTTKQPAFGAEKGKALIVLFNINKEQEELLYEDLQIEIEGLKTLENNITFPVNTANLPVRGEIGSPADARWVPFQIDNVTPTYLISNLTPVQRFEIVNKTTGELIGSLNSADIDPTAALAITKNYIDAPAEQKAFSINISSETEGIELTENYAGTTPNVRLVAKDENGDFISRTFALDKAVIFPDVVNGEAVLQTDVLNLTNLNTFVKDEASAADRVDIRYIFTNKATGRKDSVDFPAIFDVLAPTIVSIEGGVEGYPGVTPATTEIAYKVTFNTPISETSPAVNTWKTIFRNSLVIAAENQGSFKYDDPSTTTYSPKTLTIALADIQTPTPVETSKVLGGYTEWTVKITLPAAAKAEIKKVYDSTRITQGARLFGKTVTNNQGVNAANAPKSVTGNAVADLATALMGGTAANPFDFPAPATRSIKPYNIGENDPAANIVTNWDTEVDASNPAGKRIGTFPAFVIEVNLNQKGDKAATNLLEAPTVIFFDKDGNEISRIDALTNGSFGTWLADEIIPGGALKWEFTFSTTADEFKAFLTDGNNDVQKQFIIRVEDVKYVAEDGTTLVTVAADKIADSQLLYQYDFEVPTIAELNLYRDAVKLPASALGDGKRETLVIDFDDTKEFSDIRELTIEFNYLDNVLPGGSLMGGISFTRTLPVFFDAAEYNNFTGAAFIVKDAAAIELTNITAGVATPYFVNDYYKSIKNVDMPATSGTEVVLVFASTVDTMGNKSARKNTNYFKVGDLLLTYELTSPKVYDPANITTLNGISFDEITLNVKPAGAASLNADIKAANNNLVTMTFVPTDGSDTKVITISTDAADAQYWNATFVLNKLTLIAPKDNDHNPINLILDYGKVYNVTLGAGLVNSAAGHYDEGGEFEIATTNTLSAPKVRISLYGPNNIGIQENADEINWYSTLENLGSENHFRRYFRAGNEDYRDPSNNDINGELYARLDFEVPVTAAAGTIDFNGGITIGTTNTEIVAGTNEDANNVRYVWIPLELTTPMVETNQPINYTLEGFGLTGKVMVGAVEFDLEELGFDPTAPAMNLIVDNGMSPIIDFTEIDGEAIPAAPTAMLGSTFKFEIEDVNLDGEAVYVAISKTHGITDADDFFAENVAQAIGVQVGDAWEFEVEITTDMFEANPANGSYSIYAYAEDKAGNEYVEELSVNLEVSAPEIESITLWTGTTTIAAADAVNAANYVDGGERIQVRINDAKANGLVKIGLETAEVNENSIYPNVDEIRIIWKDGSYSGDPTDRPDGFYFKQKDFESPAASGDYPYFELVYKKGENTPFVSLTTFAKGIATFTTGGAYIPDSLNTPDVTADSVFSLSAWSVGGNGLTGTEKEGYFKVKWDDGQADRTADILRIRRQNPTAVYSDFPSPTGVTFAVTFKAGKKPTALTSNDLTVMFEDIDPAVYNLPPGNNNGNIIDPLRVEVTTTGAPANSYLVKIKPDETLPDPIKEFGRLVISEFKNYELPTGSNYQYYYVNNLDIEAIDSVYNVEEQNFVFTINQPVLAISGTVIAGQLKDVTNNRVLGNVSSKAIPTNNPSNEIVFDLSKFASKFEAGNEYQITIAAEKAKKVGVTAGDYKSPKLTGTFELPSEAVPMRVMAVTRSNGASEKAGSNLVDPYTGSMILSFDVKYSHPFANGEEPTEFSMITEPFGTIVNVYQGYGYDEGTTPQNIVYTYEVEFNEFDMIPNDPTGKSTIVEVVELYDYAGAELLEPAVATLGTEKYDVRLTWQAGEPTFAPLANATIAPGAKYTMTFDDVDAESTVSYVNGTNVNVAAYDAGNGSHRKNTTGTIDATGKIIEITAPGGVIGLVDLVVLPNEIQDEWGNTNPEEISSVRYYINNPAVKSITRYASYKDDAGAENAYLANDGKTNGNYVVFAIRVEPSPVTDIIVTDITPENISTTLPNIAMLTPIVDAAGTTYLAQVRTPAADINARKVHISAISGYTMPALNDTFNVRKAFLATMTLVEPTGNAVSVVPANGKVAFDEDLTVVQLVNQVSLSYNLGADEAPCVNPDYNISDNTLTFTYGNLAPATAYKVKVAGSSFMDAWGNLNENLETSADFTTKEAPVILTITRANPTGEKTNELTVKFNINFKPTAYPDVLTLDDIIVTANGTAVPAANLTLTQNPTDLHIYSVEVALGTRRGEVKITQVASYGLPGANDKFDVRNPYSTIVTLGGDLATNPVPANPGTRSIVFDDVQTLFGADLNGKVTVTYNNGANQVVVSNINLAADNKTITFDMDLPLLYTTQYTVTLAANSVKDEYGNPNPVISKTFNTGLAPMVSKIERVDPIGEFTNADEVKFKVTVINYDVVLGGLPSLTDITPTVSNTTSFTVADMTPTTDGFTFTVTAETQSADNVAEIVGITGVSIPSIPNFAFQPATNEKYSVRKAFKGTFVVLPLVNSIIPLAGDIKITFADDEDQSGAEGTLDDGVTLGTTDITPTFADDVLTVSYIGLTSNTVYSLTLNADVVKDAWGNLNPATPFIGYTTKPAITSITRANPASEFTNAGEVQFEVTLEAALPADPVAGDFTVSNGTVTGVSGAGDIWTVTVTTGTALTAAEEVEITGVAATAGFVFGSPTTNETYSVRKAFLATIDSYTPTGTDIAIAAATGSVAFTDVEDVPVQTPAASSVKFVDGSGTTLVESSVADIAVVNTLTYNYPALAYNTNYTIKLNANSVKDAWGNLNTEEIAVGSFTTRIAPTVNYIRRYDPAEAKTTGTEVKFEIGIANVPTPFTKADFIVTVGGIAGTALDPTDLELTGSGPYYLEVDAAGVLGGGEVIVGMTGGIDLSNLGTPSEANNPNYQTYNIRTDYGAVATMTDPVSEATLVPQTGTITISFNEPVTLGTALQLELKCAITSVADVTIVGTLAPNGLSATFDYANLFGNTVWNVTLLANSVKDAWGLDNPETALGYFSTEASTFYITAASGGSGTITPSGSVRVTQGDDQTFTFAPAAGYEIDVVLIDNVASAYDVATSSYTFDSVQANHTIVVNFTAIPSYNIIAASGGNGTITPTGSVSVTRGDDQTFTFTPDNGYEIDVVLVDNVATAYDIPTSSYTFTDVQAGHTIVVNYKVSTGTSFVVTKNVYPLGSGTIDGDATATHGTDYIFDVIPATGYNLVTDGVTVTETVGGASVPFTPVGGTEYEIEGSNITANITITATFELNVYSITTNGTNGSALIAGGATTVTHGNDVEFTLNPNPGYQLAVDGLTVTVGGQEVDPAENSGTYTIANVTGAVVINVVYELIPAVTYLVEKVVNPTDAAGSIAGLGIATANTSYTFHVFANTGYTLTNVTYQVGSGSVTPITAAIDGGYTIPAAEVTGNIEIVANFTLNVYDITVTPTTDGTVQITAPSVDADEVEHGDDVEFTLSADTDYQLDNLTVTVGGTSVDPTEDNGTYTIANVTGDVVITATFEPIPVGTYNVTKTVNPTGAGTISGLDLAVDNTDYTFTVSGNTGYTLTDVTYQVGSGSVETITATGGIYTIPAAEVTDDIAIIANFTLNTYTITSSVIGNGTYGTISPTPNAIVNHGANQTFTFAPESGYKVKEVKVDDVVVTPMPTSTYEFTNVTANHTISVEFELIPVVVNPTVTSIVRYGLNEKTNADEVEFLISISNNTTTPAVSDFIIQNGTITGIRNGAQTGTYIATVSTNTGIVTITGITSVPSITDLTWNVTTNESYNVRKAFAATYTTTPNGNDVAISVTNGAIAFNETISVVDLTDAITVNTDDITPILTGGNQLRFNFVNALDYSTQYTVTLDAGVVSDEWGNTNGLITYNFTTADPVVAGPEVTYFVGIASSRSTLEISWATSNATDVIIRITQDSTDYDAPGSGLNDYEIALSSATNYNFIGLSRRTKYYIFIWATDGTDISEYIVMNITTPNIKDGFIVSENNTFAVSDVTPLPAVENASFDISVLEGGNLNVSIYNLAGSKVMNAVTNMYLDDNTETKVDMNFANLANGVYTIEISVGDDRVVRTIVINK